MAVVPLKAASVSDGESPASSPLADLDALAGAGLGWRSVKRGETAYLAGDKFNAIYGVRAGFFKVGNVAAMGREQVMGFFMRAARSRSRRGPACRRAPRSPC